MAGLPKQVLNINFGKGVDTKTDPFQVAPGKFLSLVNTMFTKGGLLQKRNGFGALGSLPDSSSTFLTTFNGNLTAIGSTLNAYSASSNSWVNKGQIQPVQLSTLSIIRSNTNQTQADSCVSPNGLVCTAFTDNVPSGGSTVDQVKFVVADSVTGQNIVAPAVIPATSGSAVAGARVFLLGNYFLVVYTTSTNHLQYIAININNPSSITVAADISSTYTPATTNAFDGVVANNAFYVAWNGSDVGGAIRVAYLDNTLALHTPVVFTGKVATHMSVCADVTGASPIIYVNFYDSGSSTGFSLAVTYQLETVFAPVSLTTSVVKNITASAQNGVCQVFYEIDNAYSYDSAIKTNFIRNRAITQAGVVSTGSTIARSVGLASKSFIVNGSVYLLSVYGSAFQPTCFLLTAAGAPIGKLAYSNGGGYLTTGLPSVSVVGNTASVAYLYKDLLQAVNKSQGVASSAGIYAQTGVNLATLTIGTTGLSTAEIGNNLHLSGGFLWMFDGYVAVEHGFHLWPDSIELTAATTGGLMTAQKYYYVALYEWTDNQGNIHRSAPSLPVSVTTTGTTSKVTVNIPTLRMTLKTANPVKIVVFRWSAAQQTYYQATSVLAPKLNDVTADSIAFVDTQADSAIVGNSILYTTGGVLENIGAPAVSAMTLFQSRLFVVDAEDQNLLWYSKQVIEGTPVEMSDLLTLYIAPTISAQGRGTGPMRCLSAMDDKLILFKHDAMYYINGQGPDNTGANSQFSEPTLIISTVGCENPNSIIFMPDGLIFQASDSSIWLLGRDLSTRYVGAPVEAYTDGATVLSAVNVPDYNQVRFTLNTGITVVYDYYYGEWSVFKNVKAVSSCLFDDLHTYISASGSVYQETIGQFLDGSTPVLISFTTAWMNLAGVQGFERFYEMLLLGVYLSPFKLQVQIAFDYADAPQQGTLVTPQDYSGTYGSTVRYGVQSPFGGQGSKFEARIFPEKQKCESFQITVQELFDPSYGTVAGAGLTLSGITLVAGMKKGYRTQSAAKSFG